MGTPATDTSNALDFVFFQVLAWDWFVRGHLYPGVILQLVSMLTPDWHTDPVCQKEVGL